MVEGPEGSNNTNWHLLVLRMFWSQCSWLFLLLCYRSWGNRYRHCGFKSTQFGFKRDLRYRKLPTFFPLFGNFSINHHVSQRPCWSEARDPVQQCKEQSFSVAWGGNVIRPGAVQPSRAAKCSLTVLSPISAHWSPLVSVPFFFF